MKSHGKPRFLLVQCTLNKNWGVTHTLQFFYQEIEMVDSSSLFILTMCPLISLSSYSTEYGGDNICLIRGIS